MIDTEVNLETDPEVNLLKDPEIDVDPIHPTPDRDQENEFIFDLRKRYIFELEGILCIISDYFNYDFKH
jgi:hypothetical protein